MRHSTREAVRPVAPYVGGKRLLSRRIIEHIEAMPHDLYAEPFIGMGGVFLRRPKRASTEVINYISGDVVTLFRILQRHYLAFIDMIRWQLTTRRDFQRLIATNPDTLTDLERAARFLYLQRTAFGGKVAGRTFGFSTTERGVRFDVTKLQPMLEDVHERLAGVMIESLDFETFINRYDRAGTLFYCDPPYWGCEDYYGKAVFERADFERLRDCLMAAKGGFIISLNDCEAVRTIFAGCRIEALETTYSVNRDASRKAGEVLIFRS